MLTFIDPNPLVTLLWIAMAIGIVVLSIGLWFGLRTRVRRYGGGHVASAVMALAIVALLASLMPGLLPSEMGIVVLLFAMLAIYRPEQVVKLTGGPSLRWRTLREGRELQLLVKKQGGPSPASLNPEVQERFERLPELEGPGTVEYVGLLQQTLLADPDSPGMREKLQELAAADAALRASLGARPAWEDELEQRASGESSPA